MWLTQAWHREEDTFDTFRLEGFDMCEICLTSLYGISDTSWKRRKQQVRQGQRRWEHASTGHTSRLTEKGATSRIWMADYFYTIGDFQPDTGQVHLPPGEKQDLSAELRQECVQESHFYQIWLDEFS